MVTNFSQSKPNRNLSNSKGTFFGGVCEVWPNVHKS